MTQKTFYVTSPIYYVNDIPHLGHAYTTLACDTLARFYRQDGYRVAFLTGTDEHGLKIEKSAEAKGIAPQDFVDNVSQTFRDLFEKMGMSHTVFGRTTSPQHKKAVNEIWNRLIKNGQIYLGSYSGWYSMRDEAFYGEDEIKDGKAPTGAPVEWVTEPSYFFKLSAWQQPLLEYYEKHPDFIAPEGRRNEVVSFVKSGLRDLSVSRTGVKWGIPVPGDEAHVMYVWLDALNIYISSLGFPDDVDQFENFWSNSLHLVGKDILRFHAVYWPAFLLAAELQPPKRIFAHGWWTKDGEKMSKSLGNVVDPIALVDTYGTDAFRYFVLREVPFGGDGDFSESAFINRLNADLANTYGNLVQRTLAFVYKNGGAVIPVPGDFTEEDKALLALPEKALSEIRSFMETQTLHRAIEKMWEVLFEGNRYMDTQKPWTLKNDDPVRMNTILYVLCEFIRKSAILTSSVTPILSEKILDQLVIPQEKRDFSAMAESLQSGVSIPEPKPLVQKVVVG